MNQRVGEAVVVAVADGIVAFWLLASLLVVAFGHTERVEFAAYAVTFFALLPLVAFAGGNGAAFAWFDALVVLVAILVARLVWVVSPGAVGMAVVAGGAAVLLLNRRRVGVGEPPRLPWLETLVGRRWTLSATAPLLVGAGLAVFLPGSVFAGRDWIVFLVALAVASAVSVVALRRVALTARLRRPGDVLVVLFLASVLLIVRGQDVTTAVYHQDFFLGPADAVLHGRTMLVDVFSQYGVGLVYFLAAIFAVVGIGYGPISLVVAAAAMVEFTVLYLVLRRTVRSQALAVAGLAVAVVACVLTPELLYVDFPSATALRFGIPTLLIAAEVVAVSAPAKRTLAAWTSAALVGLASFWSFETFFYTALTYATIAGVAAVQRRRPRDLIPAAVRPVLAVLVVQVAFAVTTRIAAGAWPEWGTYFQYLRLYSTQGFGGLPVGAWSPGFLLGGVYFASALGLWFVARSPAGEELVLQLAVTAGFTGSGVATFSYFVGRSHPNNLHVIVVPAVAVAVVWVDIVARLRPLAMPALRRWTGGFALLLVAAIVASGWGNLRAMWPDTALGVVTTKRPPHSLRWLHWYLTQLSKPYPYAAAVSDGMELVSRYDPQGRPVAVILSGELSEQYLLATNKANAIPLADQEQDDLLLATRRKILTAVRALPAGTLVLTDSYPTSAPDFTGSIFGSLEDHHSLALVARTPNVALLRIRS